MTTIVDSIQTLAALDPTRYEKRLNILVFYAPIACQTNAVREYLEAFTLFSKHKVYYATALDKVELNYDINQFDVVVIHYSIRLTFRDNSIYALSPACKQAITDFRGYKVAIAQDEYEHTNYLIASLQELKVDLLLSCVPTEHIREVYPEEQLPLTDIVTVLTGYVPNLDDLQKFYKPFDERRICLGYRGRELPFHYGDLGREKREIGRSLKAYCASHHPSLPVDIEYKTRHRIYGDAWYTFVADCQYMLGTESGANVFDFNGELKEASARYKGTYGQYRERYLADKEGKIRMNQISPKLFEAIALRVGLVLYEGQYSGVLEPEKHYLPLKKDGSNLEETFRQLQDKKLLRDMTDRAYADVIQSELYTYRTFIRQFDMLLGQKVKTANERKIVEISFPLAVGGGRLADSCASVSDLYDAPQTFPDPFRLGSRYAYLADTSPWGFESVVAYFAHTFKSAFKQALLFIRSRVFRVLSFFVSREKLFALYKVVLSENRLYARLREGLSK